VWRTPEIWQAQTTFPKNVSKYKRTICNNQSERKRSSLFIFRTFANSALLSTQTDFDSTSSNNSSSSYSWNCWVMRRQGGLSKPIEHEMGSHFQVGHLFFFWNNARKVFRLHDSTTQLLKSPSLGPERFQITSNVQAFWHFTSALYKSNPLNPWNPWRSERRLLRIPWMCRNYMLWMQRQTWSMCSCTCVGRSPPWKKRHINWIAKLLPVKSDVHTTWDTEWSLATLWAHPVWMKASTLTHLEYESEKQCASGISLCLAMSAAALGSRNECQVSG
jgi:hypothetical protein